jgi:hypothetical protein
MSNFDHVILAIQLPVETSAAAMDARRDALLFFDPTDPYTPLGQIPASLQGNSGLLVRGDAGELVTLPSPPLAANRMERRAKVTLSESGTLAGEVRETFSGATASSLRGDLLDLSEADRRKALERYVGRSMPTAKVSSVSAENLEDLDKDPVVRFAFESSNYARPAGLLMVVRPAVLRLAGMDLLERKERKQPIEFSATVLNVDSFEMTLPAGYRIDEAPTAADLNSGVANYKSRVETGGNSVHYTREYSVTSTRIPVERLDDMKKFYRQVAADERAVIVLKRATP